MTGGRIVNPPTSSPPGQSDQGDVLKTLAKPSLIGAAVSRPPPFERVSRVPWSGVEAASNCWRAENDVGQGQGPRTATSRSKSEAKKNQTTPVTLGVKGLADLLLILRSGLLNAPPRD